MTTRHDSYAALRIRSFRQLILSVLGETLGSQIQTVVVGWQVYSYTRDPLSLGLIGLAEALPFISCALLAGHVADRDDRRRVVSWFDHLANWENDEFVRSRSYRLPSGENLYVLHATPDFRIFFTLDEGRIVVLDLARKDTLEKFGQPSGQPRK